VPLGQVPRQALDQGLDLEVLRIGRQRAPERAGVELEVAGDESHALDAHAVLVADAARGVRHQELGLHGDGHAHLLDREGDEHEIGVGDGGRPLAVEAEGPECEGDQSERGEETLHGDLRVCEQSTGRAGTEWPPHRARAAGDR
jgi:hypothetical protein